MLNVALCVLPRAGEGGSAEPSFEVYFAFPGIGRRVVELLAAGPSAIIVALDLDYSLWVRGVQG
jgi:hypothetical protein